MWDPLHLNSEADTYCIERVETYFDTQAVGHRQKSIFPLRPGCHVQTYLPSCFPSLCPQSPDAFSYPCPLLHPTATPYHPLFYPVISLVPRFFFLPPIFAASSHLSMVPPCTFACKCALNTLIGPLMKEPITNSLLLVVVLFIILVSS